MEQANIGLGRGILGQTPTIADSGLKLLAGFGVLPRPDQLPAPHHAGVDQRCTRLQQIGPALGQRLQAGHGLLQLIAAVEPRTGLQKAKLKIAIGEAGLVFGRCRGIFRQGFENFLAVGKFLARFLRSAGSQQGLAAG